jgi:hypothetical protein
MKHKNIPGWQKIYETYDYMQCEIIESKLTDAKIQYQVLNKADIGYTMEVGNAKLGREAVGLPIWIYVKQEDFENAKKLLEEDFSKLFDDPDSEFISE